jgi:hypothetical protein
VLAIARAAPAQVTAERVRERVAAGREVAIAGGLVAIGRQLVAVGGGLVAVGGGLVSIGARLIGVRQVAVAAGECSAHGRSTLVAVGARG